MKLKLHHSWPDNTDEAIAIQQRLRTTVIKHDQLGSVRHVAGVDVGFEAEGTITCAAVVVLNLPDLQLRDQALARRPTSFPYIPGLLSFREAPAVLDALEQLQIVPDLLLCDGQGIAHPRRFGIACHLGVLTGLPTIGVAKSLLVGTHAEVLNEPGAWQPLLHRGEVVGAVVRTRVGVRPMYVSIGHRVSLATAIQYVLQCTLKYRLPETTRLAHKLASGGGMPS